jgi:glycine dehydrogenase subunit 1
MTAAAIYLSMLGPQGLRNVALTAHANTRALLDKLTAIPGVSRVFTGNCFHEAVIRVSAPAADVLRALRAQGILGGHALGGDYLELGDAILVCATETKTDDDLEHYAQQLQRILSRRREAPPCAYKS